MAIEVIKTTYSDTILFDRATKKMVIIPSEELGDVTAAMQHILETYGEDGENVI